MKNLILALLVSLCSTLCCGAQSFSFGLKAGGTLSYFSGTLEYELNEKVRWHAGAFFEYLLSPKLGLQTEVLYNKQGASVPNSYLDYKFNYLQIPLMTKYYISRSFSIEGGPQLGFSITNDIFAHLAETIVPLNSPVLSATAGATYYTQNGIFMQTRYNHSFTTVDAMAMFYNPFVTVSLGYQLGKNSSVKSFYTPAF